MCMKGIFVIMECHVACMIVYCMCWLHSARRTLAFTDTEPGPGVTFFFSPH
jgi:hypothetical protein